MYLMNAATVQLLTKQTRIVAHKTQVNASPRFGGHRERRKCERPYAGGYMKKAILASRFDLPFYLRLPSKGFFTWDPECWKW